MALNDTISALGNAIINLVDKKTPIATVNTVGMVKPDGSTINIDANGVISSTGGGSGLEVCYIGMALYVDETKGLGRYLNGQIVDINTNTQEFLNRLLQIQSTNPDYFTTEDNWQTEATLNIDGCVYKFVLNYADDGETVISVRLPKYPDYVEINVGGTLPVVGNGMSLGLFDGSSSSAFGLRPTSNGVLTGDSSGSNVILPNTIPVGTVIVAGQAVGVTTDPTKSGIQTTLKQTKLKMRYFIQIATGAETENNIINTLENVNGFTLLESKYSDKPLYNESWLLSNGQYNPKGTYPTVYEGLQVEYNTEIEVGTTVTLPSGTRYTKRGLSVKLNTEDYTDYDFVLKTKDETFMLPLKTKLASGKAVVGNGSQILFQQEVTGQTLRMGSQGAGYAVLIPPTGGSNVANIGRVGLSQDPIKSGIELSDSGLYLYYYVGNISQNNGIINAGRIGEHLATKTDKVQAGRASMPSNRYIDLTLGASPSVYIAPADGWYSVTKESTATHQNLTLESGGLRTTSVATGSGGWCSVFIPVKRGDEVQVTYNVGGPTIYNRFTYAEGSKED